MRQSLQLDFERLTIALAAELRKDLDEDVNSFIFRATISGRVDGDLKVAFQLENLYDSENNVEGNDIQAVINEYIRRRGWKKKYNALCLPNVEAPQKVVPLDEEIPF